MTVSFGLDLSLTAPGAVMLSKEKGSKILEVLNAEQIPVPPASKCSRWERVDVICRRVSSLLEAHRPDIVVIEGYGQVRHGGVQSFVKCVEVGTAVRMVLRSNQLDWMEVPPTSLKKFTCGTGKLPSGAKGKKEMIRHVGERWGFETSNHNIADAYALARFGLSKCSILAVEPWQVDVLDAVKVVGG